MVGVILGFFINILDINSSEINILYIFLAGILAFSFFLIPGISGSAILLILGVWKPIVQALAEFNFDLLIPFWIRLPDFTFSFTEAYQFSIFPA